MATLQHLTEAGLVFPLPEAERFPVQTDSTAPEMGRGQVSPTRAVGCDWLLSLSIWLRECEDTSQLQSLTSLPPG